MNVAETIGRALADLGVEQVFGLVGSGNFVTTNAMCARGATFLSARHETSAVAMADGYARVTGRVGVVTVHQGPGFTNALTGMTEAAKGHSPVLLLAADTPAGWVHSNFRVDQSAAAAALGIQVERVTSVETARAELARAWQLVAVEGRATVLLMPLDVQRADAGDWQPIAPSLPWAAAPDRGAVVAATELFTGSQRPVIIAGRGAVNAGAGPALRGLGERSGALLATSLNANGLFAGDPFDLGISGGFATPLAAELIADADLVLAFGAALNRWTTRHGSLVGRHARVVHVDRDPAAIGRQQPVDLGIVADARLAAEAMSDTLGAPRTGYRTGGMAARIASGRWREQPFAEATGGGAVDPRALTIALDDLLPAERLVVVDSGHFQGWPAMYLSVPDARGFVFNQAFQSVGLGLGTAVGAAYGRPDRLVVAAVGDGGAFMALGELESVARSNRPMLVVVYDDGAYGAEVHHFGPEGHPLETVRFPPADLAAVARSVGMEAATVREVGDLEVLSAWLDSPRERPMLLHALVQPDVVGAWLPEAFRS